MTPATRTIAKAAAAMAVAVAGAFALSTPGLSHPHDGKEKIEKVILLTQKDGAKAGKHRTIRIDGSEVHCDAEKTTVDEATGDKERTRIVLCGAGAQLSSADRAKRLEELLGRLRSDEHFSAEHKARVEAALEEAITKLRATN
jgi:hypothetical protein